MSQETGIQALATRVAQEFNTLRNELWQEVEVDFGYPALKTKSKLIVNSGVVATDNLAIVRSGQRPTGKGIDEAIAEPVIVSAIARDGSYIISATALTGKIGGTFKFLVTFS